MSKPLSSSAANARMASAEDPTSATGSSATHRFAPQSANTPSRRSAAARWAAATTAGSLVIPAACARKNVAPACLGQLYEPSASFVTARTRYL
ncbi:MAG: hypothetical protein IPQ09_03365 [Myxococcales bacterium]|nr:hypothetical protein [Myxococcales bacterium]